MGHFTAYGFDTPPMGLSGKGFIGALPPAATITPAKTWTQVVTGYEGSVDAFQGVFWVNNLWMITTTQPGVRMTIITSADGVHWVQRLIFPAATVAIDFPTAAFGAGVYAINSADGVNVPRLITSPDLGTWTVRNMGFPAGDFPFAICFGNGAFLVTKGGSHPRYATSPDGITWTQQSTYVPNQWGQPVFDGTQFVAPVLNASNQPKIVTSPDGIAWTESLATLTLFSDPAFIAAHGISQYVVGDPTSSSGNSVNGILTSVTPFVFPDGQGTAWIAHGSDWARCNGLDSSVESASDGIVWHPDIVPAVTATIGMLTWNGTEWIAVGSQTGATNIAITRGA